MPVDLSTIPEPAERSSPPSLKRWLFTLTAAVAICGLATLYLWPADKPTQTPLFWYCFVLIPFALWLFVFGFRWLLYIFSNCVSDGWDEEREWALQTEIERGQRYVNVLAQVVHLPHAVSSTSLSMQMMSQEIVLPSVFDETSFQVIRKSRFDNTDSLISERLCHRIGALLTDRTLMKTLGQLPDSSRQITVSLLAEADGVTDDVDLPALWKRIQLDTSLQLATTITPGGGLDVLDKWLDTAVAGQTLLVIGMRLTDGEKDGLGDAAVALLLQMPTTEKATSETIAKLHRPEQTKAVGQLKETLLQSLHWGQAQTKDIMQVWLAGMGCDNQAQSLFSSIGIEFPAVVAPEQICDIDISTGLTGKVSTWLALAIASDHAAIQHHSQLVMSTNDIDPSLPWFAVVHPVNGDSSS